MEWFDKFRHFHSTPHWMKYLDDYSELNLYAREQWSVVFLDHTSGDRRAGDALLFKDSAEFIIIHDAQADDVMTPLRPMLGRDFPYWKIYDRYFPHTMMLSAKRPIPEGI